ncbi:MAG: hypothetical protein WCS73_11905 [Lentisphaeria bacterium]
MPWNVPQEENRSWHLASTKTRGYTPLSLLSGGSDSLILTYLCRKQNIPSNLLDLTGC